MDDASNELLSSVTREWSVDDQTPPGTRIGSLSDIVTSSSLRRERYLYILNNPGQMPFVLNSATGEVFVVSKLNLTSKSYYELDVQVESTSGATTPISAKVVIKVARESGSKRPQFDPDPVNVKVREDAQVGTVIHTLKPSLSADQDLNYVMLEQMPTSAFVIEDKTGKIKVAKQLDYEKDHNYVLTVRVTETSSQLSTFVTVVVMISDTNDNRPMFVSSDKVKLSSDTALGVPFMTLAAVDHDPGNNGKIRYSVRNGNEDGTFTLDPDSGDLSLVKPGSRQDYYLQVRAVDPCTGW